MSTNNQTTSVQTAPAQNSELSAMMQVVRNTIFKNSTNEELAMFFHICKSNNVSPLDRLIFPSVYKDTAGNRTVVVVTSIDLMRSRSMETGQDDGQDEPEYSDETIQFQSGDEDFEVPEWCKVRIYRKDVSRPYIGIARWKEFYPGDKRGHLWRKMPMVMLAKCAEAQARRLAFPKELSKLYEQAEMDQATEMLALPSNNDKANVQPSTAAPETASQDTDAPNDEERKSKRLISAKQEGLVYAKCKQHNVDPESVKAWLAVIKKTPRGHFWQLSWSKPNKEAKSEFEKVLETIEKKPEFYTKYLPVKTAVTDPKTDAAPSPVQKVTDTGEPTPREAFELNLNLLIENAGLGTEKIDSELKKLGYAAISEVPEAEFQNVLNYFGEVL